MEGAGSIPRQKVSLQSGNCLLSCIETLKCLVQKAGFSREIVEVFALDLRASTAAIYQRKWSRFLHWCHRQNLSPCKVTVQQIAEFFLYLRRELKLLVPAVNGYRAACDSVFSLTCVDLAANRITSKMLCSFE